MKLIFYGFFGIIFIFCYRVLGNNPDWPPVCPNIIEKYQWKARPAYAVDYASIPVKNVIIHHTVTPRCKTNEECSRLIRAIQNFHIEKMEFHDIGYNFLIGGDGNVYEGVGWHKVGAHTRGYNSRSLGIAFIGDFADTLPNRAAFKALKRFLDCGVQLGELEKDYKLFAARQVSGTSSPGSRLYKELRNWPNFCNNP